MFNFERLDILCAESDLRVKSYDHLEFSRASVVKFCASRYIIRLNRTSELKDMTFEFLEKFYCSISNVPIYCVPESDLRVKSNDHLNFSRASVAQFRASQYIMRLNMTSVVKSNDHLNFSTASVI